MSDTPRMRLVAGVREDTHHRLHDRMVPIGYRDSHGFAEVLAYAHEDHAQRYVQALNHFTDLYLGVKCALADLEGIMPDFEPSGDRAHPAWTTIMELKRLVRRINAPVPGQVKSTTSQSAR